MATEVLVGHQQGPSAAWLATGRQAAEQTALATAEEAVKVVAGAAVAARAAAGAAEEARVGTLAAVVV